MNKGRHGNGRFTPGSRPVGRAKGVPNKLTKDRLSLTADGKLLLHEELYAIGTSDMVAVTTRVSALAAAAPYYAPRARFNTNPLDIGRPTTIEDCHRLQGDLLVGLLAGKLDLEVVVVASNLIKAIENSILGVDIMQMVEELRGKVPPTISVPHHVM